MPESLKEMKDSSSIFIHAVQVFSAQSMKISVSLFPNEQSLQVINTTTKVDCGANVSCINWGFVQKNKITTEWLACPISLRNADGSINARGKILFVAPLFFKVGGITQKVRFYVMNCGSENVILGLPWLKEANPSIDWKKETLSLDDSVIKDKDLIHQHEICTTSYSTFNPTDPDPPKGPSYYEALERKKLFKYIDFEEPKPFTHCTLRTSAIQSIIVNGAKRWPHNQYIQKVNKAMELAQKKEKLKPKLTLPPDFSVYTAIFEKPKDGELPPSWSYNHAINLTEDFIPKVAKVYPLSPNEREAAEKFVEDNLREEKIWPPKLPQAALFFFVGKKNGSLRPCQDYHYLNKHTVKDAYPLPLISDLIDKLKGASVFTSVLKSSCNFSLGPATGLDRNWSQPDCSCKLPPCCDL